MYARLLFEKYRRRLWLHYAASIISQCLMDIAHETNILFEQFYQVLIMNTSSFRKHWFELGKYVWFNCFMLNVNFSNLVVKFKRLLSRQLRQEYVICIINLCKLSNVNRLFEKFSLDHGENNQNMAWKKIHVNNFMSSRKRVNIS